MNKLVFPFKCKDKVGERRVQSRSTPSEAKSGSLWTYGPAPDPAATPRVCHRPPDFTMYTQYHNDIDNNSTTNTFSNIVKYKCRYWRTLSFQVRKHLLVSDFTSSTQGDRHDSYYADHAIRPHQRAAISKLGCK